MISEFREWMRDNWNHPSVAIWDANNETWYPDFTTKIIPAVRALDLSNRPWENSYTGPEARTIRWKIIPTSTHGMAGGGPEFRMSELEQRVSRPGNDRAAHRPRPDPQRVRLAVAQSRRLTHRADEQTLPAPAW